MGRQRSHGLRVCGEKLHGYPNWYPELQSRLLVVHNSLIELVGATRFELATPCTPCWCCIPVSSGIFIADAPTKQHVTLHFGRL
jgi:hypothetical protein